MQDENDIARPLRFFIGNAERRSAIGQGRLQQSVEELLADVRSRYPYIFGDDATLDVADPVPAYIVGELQRFSLIQTKADAKGMAYEQLVGANLRGDRGEYFTPRTVCTMAAVMLMLTMMRLGDVTERIFIPPRFKRVYVDEAHGVPFLQGTHIVHFWPADPKYLSRSAHRNPERWIINAGWVLVTCSGTIGRVAIALQQWDGWAASQHTLRVAPKADGICPAGYRYAWFSFPLWQAQFNGIHGAVVDELTADHVGEHPDTRAADSAATGYC